MHDPKNISDRARKLLNVHLVGVFHVLLALSVVADALIRRSTYSPNTLYGVLAGASVFLLLGFIRLKNVAKINEAPAVYLILYHLLFTICFGLFMPAYSPWIFIWLLCLYLSNYFYGSQGYSLSIASLFITLLSMSFRTLPDTSSALEYLTFIGTQFLMMFVLSRFFIVSEDIGDKDRRLLQNSVERAEIERQRLTSLINSMSDGVLATDAEGIIRLYNAASLDILDTHKSLEGKKLTELIAVIDSSARTIDIIAEASTKQMGISTSDYLLVYPNGEKINLYVNVAPIKLSFRRNAERGYIVSLRDISHEKSLEEERNEFISVVSHELRTPIAIAEANISNAQFMVEKDSDPGAIKSSLDAAHKQALFLANMINDLSTLSRAERGRLNMTMEDVRPAEVLSSLYDDFKTEADLKKIKLKTSIDEHTPETIISSRLYIREIMQNLISNAIKYTKEGYVSVKLIPAEGGVEFVVEDTGIGISKSDQKRIFDKFFRSEDFRTRESSGTGLGLYVTKKLMKLIRADMEVKSRLNQGSVFRVYVPDMSASSSD